MKKLSLYLLIVFLSVLAANGQILPNKIKNYLDANYTSVEDGAWKQVPGACDGNKSVLTGDFEGDGQPDYLVRFKTGKTPETTRLYLVAFLNRFGEYTPYPFYETALTGDLIRSASSVIPKGTTVNLGGEGEGPNMVLPTDAVTNYICETDASATFVYKNGEIVNIRDGFAPSSPNTTVTQTVQPTPMATPTTTAQPTPMMTPTPFVPVPATSPIVQPTPNQVITTPQTDNVPNLSGNWTRKPSDGSVTDLKISIAQSGANFTLKVNENQVPGAIQGEKFVVNGLAESGTIEQNGNAIRWSDGVWVRESGSPATSPANPTFPPANSSPANDSMPNLTGNWIEKKKDGNESPNRKSFQIIQTGNKLQFVIGGMSQINGMLLTGSVKNETFIMDLEGTGTIEQGGNVIRFRSGGYLVREGYAGPVGTGTGIPPLEQQCLTLAGNLAPWNKPNVTDDEKTYLTVLCMATDSPQTTVDCFASERQKQPEVLAAVRVCSEFAKAVAANKGGSQPTPTNPTPNSTPNPTPVTTPTTQNTSGPDLSGKWILFDANGKVLPSTVGTITQNETGYVFEIRTPNSMKKATGYFQNGKIITGWDITGNISTDGKLILWSDKTIWTRQ